MSQTRRISPYSREEMARICDDREKHPNLTTTQWCQQYPISVGIYYAFLKKLGRKTPGVNAAATAERVKKRLGRPPGTKNKQPRLGRPPLVKEPKQRRPYTRKAGGIVALLAAMREVRRANDNVDRLAKRLSPAELREALERLL